MLLDGGDLTCILEGRFDFTDALRAKVRAASIQGDPYVSVHSLSPSAAGGSALASYPDGCAIMELSCR